MIYDTECQFLSTSRNLSAIQIVSRCSRRYFSIIILWKIPIPLIPGVVVSVFFSYSWPRLLSIFSPYSFRVPGLPIFGLVSSHSRPPCSLRIPALHGLLFVFSPCSFFLSLLISDPVSSPWPRLLFRAVSSPYSQYSLRISGLVSSQDTCPLRNISVFLASSPLILASSPLLNTRRIEREREKTGKRKYREYGWKYKEDGENTEREDGEVNILASSIFGMKLAHPTLRRWKKLRSRHCSAPLQNHGSNSQSNYSQ